MNHSNKKIKNNEINQPIHSDILTSVQEMLRPCIQCGTCSASCPNEFAMDHTPRHLWRLVLTGHVNDIFQSRTFALCSSCYYCTLRCPRGLQLTNAMARLKQIASKFKTTKKDKTIEFYNQLLDSVRRNGRVRESEFMMLFFISMKNPLLPLQYTPLAIKFMTKGKISMQLPSFRKGLLDKIFNKVEELEK